MLPPINTWTQAQYKAFFEFIKNFKSYLKNAKYSYIPNPKGGFMGMWWTMLDDSELNAINLTDDYIDELYIQIENHKIVIRMTYHSDDDRNKIFQANQWIYNICHKFLLTHGIALIKNRFAFKKSSSKNYHSMAIGYFEFDETNYDNRLFTINHLANTIKKYPQKFQFPC